MTSLRPRTDSADRGPRLRVRLLGQLEVTAADGTAVEIRAAKVRGLLAYLAATAGRRAPREKVATLLWGDTGQRARDNLRQALSTLRRAIGDSASEIIVNEGDAIVIDPESVEIDLILLRMLASSEDGESLEQALRMVDELAPDLVVREEPFEDWLDEERRRLSELAADLGQRVRRRAPLALPSLPSVAVLPFREVPAHAETRYFGDGLAEDLTIALSRFDSLFVISRQSAFRYRDEDTDPRRVGVELGVHYLVTGTLRRSGDRIRVLAELVDTSDGHQVWAHRYDRQIDDVFELQDALTDTLVATLVGRVESDRLARTRTAPAPSLDAYHCLLRGKDHHHRYSRSDNVAAEVLLERAIELDPTYAAAHAWMACVLAQRNTFEPEPALFSRAYEFVRRALELDEADSECHRILGAYFLMQRRFDAAEHHQRRALDLNPNDDRIVCQMGEILTYLGRADEAVPWIERALRLNPFHPGTFHGMLAHALFDGGRPAEAADVLRRAPQKHPTYAAVGVASLWEASRREEARDELARLVHRVPRFDAGRLVRGLPYRDGKDADRLREALEAAAGG